MPIFRNILQMGGKMLLTFLASCFSGCLSSDEPYQDSGPSCWEACDGRRKIVMVCDGMVQDVVRRCGHNERCDDFFEPVCEKCEFERNVCNEFEEVWAEDSCGYYSFVQRCDLCEHGECVSCDSRYTSECISGNIWRVDACGEEELETECESGECDPETDECYPCGHWVGTTCVDRQLVVADSCDNIFEILDDCADEGSCVDKRCCNPQYFYHCNYDLALERWTVVRDSDCYPDLDIFDICDRPADRGACCADAYPPYCCNEGA